MLEPLSARFGSHAIKDWHALVEASAFSHAPTCVYRTGLQKRDFSFHQPRAVDLRVLSPSSDAGHRLCLSGQGYEFTVLTAARLSSRERRYRRDHRNARRKLEPALSPVSDSRSLSKMARSEGDSALRFNLSVRSCSGRRCVYLRNIFQSL